jgi:hypothetical protein
VIFSMGSFLAEAVEEAKHVLTKVAGACPEQVRGAILGLLSQVADHAGEGFGR